MSRPTAPLLLQLDRGRIKMSRQYNMYNVQLSEFWKQRCTKESIHNAPYLFDTEDTEDVASVTSGRTPSMVSVASTATQQKVRVPRPPK